MRGHKKGFTTCYSFKNVVDANMDILNYYAKFHFAKIDQ